MNLLESLNDDMRCEIESHFLDKVQFVCIHEYCSASQRLCCSYCKFNNHQNHSSSLVSLGDFTNKILRSCNMLQKDLNELELEGQVGNIYETKLEKKVQEIANQAKQHMQNILTYVKNSTSARTQQIYKSIDERKISESIYDLQLRLQKLVNRPWSHQTNEQISLMTRLFRGERTDDLFEEKYFISQQDSQNINTFFQQVHSKLDQLFKNSFEQVEIIYKEASSLLASSQLAQNPYILSERSSSMSNPDSKLKRSPLPPIKGDRPQIQVVNNIKDKYRQQNSDMIFPSSMNLPPFLKTPENRTMKGNNVTLNKSSDITSLRRDKRNEDSLDFFGRENNQRNKDTSIYPKYTEKQKSKKSKSKRVYSLSDDRSHINKSIVPTTTPKKSFIYQKKYEEDDSIRESMDSQFSEDYDKLMINRKLTEGNNDEAASPIRMQRMKILQNAYGIGGNKQKTPQVNSSFSSNNPSKQPSFQINQTNLMPQNLTIKNQRKNSPQKFFPNTLQRVRNEPTYIPTEIINQNEQGRLMSPVQENPNESLRLINESSLQSKNNFTNPNNNCVISNQYQKAQPSQINTAPQYSEQTSQFETLDNNQQRGQVKTAADFLYSQLSPEQKQEFIQNQQYQSPTQNATTRKKSLINLQQAFSDSDMTETPLQLPNQRQSSQNQYANQLQPSENFPRQNEEGYLLPQAQKTQRDMYENQKGNSPQLQNDQYYQQEQVPTRPNSQRIVRSPSNSPQLMAPVFMREPSQGLIQIQQSPSNKDKLIYNQMQDQNYPQSDSQTRNSNKQPQIDNNQQQKIFQIPLSNYPQPLNREECRLKVSPTYIDFLTRPVENDPKKIKENKPHKWWISQKGYPPTFKPLQILAEIQQKYGYLHIPEIEEGQSRIELLKADKNAVYYEGEWLLGERHGKGTQIMENSSIYQGQWRNGQMDGKGRLITKEGNVYEGDFIQDRIIGKGTMHFADGTEYIGRWKDNNFEGMGKKSWASGAYYQGMFVKGVKEGKGTFVWSDGSYYQGDFKNNSFDGKGVYQWKNGRQYVGDWREGKMNGHGKEIQISGIVYEGTFVADKKSGFGIIIFSSRKRYEGNWANDRPHGEGVMVEDGIGRKGIWNEGKFTHYL